MNWQKIVASTDFPGCGVLEASVEDTPILIWRQGDGSFAAISAICPHMQNYIPNGLAPAIDLSALLRDNNIVCPFHGWRFDHQGKYTKIPPGQTVPKKVERGEPITPSWPVREHEGWIEVDY